MGMELNPYLTMHKINAASIKHHKIKPKTVKGLEEHTGKNKDFLYSLAFCYFLHIGYNRMLTPLSLISLLP